MPVLLGSITRYDDNLYGTNGRGFGEAVVDGQISFALPLDVACIVFS